MDIVLLFLLILFFGILQRSRPQLHFRLWFAGWIFVFVSLLIWEVEFTEQSAQKLQDVARETMLLLGGMSFTLSFAVKKERLRHAILLGLTACVPGTVAIAAATLRVSPYWFLALLILAGEAIAVWVTVDMVEVRWRNQRNALIVASGATTVILLVVARFDGGSYLPDYIMAQVFLYAAFAYAIGTPRRSPAGFAGTLGFAMWGLAYASDAIKNPLIMKPIYYFWDLPKYFVAFGMILSIFESSNREVARLAERFRILYDDFRLLFEHHPHPMWIYDAATLQFLSVNDEAVRRYGYTREEFLRMKVQELCAPEEHCDGEIEARSGALRHRYKDGTEVTVEMTGQEILFGRRQARFVLAVDITERERLNQELLYLAHHDALTSLPNRLTLDDRIQQCIARSVREERKAVLLTIDVDRFKLINDTYGHLIGDECLKEVARRLQTRIRRVDTVARTGGEEFTAIIGGLKQVEDAALVASTLRELFDTPMLLGGNQVKLTISIGAAIYPDDGEEPEVLRRRSDQALYHAKRTGRNKVVFASPEVSEAFEQTAGDYGTLPFVATEDGMGSQRGRETVS